MPWGFAVQPTRPPKPSSCQLGGGHAHAPNARARFALGQVHQRVGSWPACPTCMHTGRCQAHGLHATCAPPHCLPHWAIALQVWAPACAPLHTHLLAFTGPRDLPSGLDPIRAAARWPGSHIRAAAGGPGSWDLSRPVARWTPQGASGHHKIRAPKGPASGPGANQLSLQHPNSPKCGLASHQAQG